MDDTGEASKPSLQLQNTCADSGGGGGGGDEPSGATTGTETSEEAQVGGSDSEETLDTVDSPSIQLDKSASRPDSLATSSHVLSGTSDSLYVQCEFEFSISYSFSVRLCMLDNFNARIVFWLYCAFVIILLYSVQKFQSSIACTRPNS